MKRSNARRVRRSTLLKKAHELVTATGGSVIVVVKSKTDTYIYTSEDADYEALTGNGFKIDNQPNQRIGFDAIDGQLHEKTVSSVSYRGGKRLSIRHVQSQDRAVEQQNVRDERPRDVSNEDTVDISIDPVYPTPSKPAEADLNFIKTATPTAPKSSTPITEPSTPIAKFSAPIIESSSPVTSPRSPTPPRPIQKKKSKGPACKKKLNINGNTKQLLRQCLDDLKKKKEPTASTSQETIPTPMDYGEHLPESAQKTSASDHGDVYEGLADSAQTFMKNMLQTPRVLCVVCFNDCKLSEFNETWTACMMQCGNACHRVCGKLEADDSFVCCECFSST